MITSLTVLCPAPAWAEVCNSVRPDWDGASVTALGEMLYLFQTPVVLLLVLASALAIRFRNELAGIAVVVGWSVATYLVTGWGTTDGVRDTAMNEGCVGSPAAFITVAVVVGIGVVLCTAPLARQTK